MNTAIYIRKRVFRVSQVGMAELLGVSQAAISRQETTGFIPTDRQRVIRDLARERGLEWSDSWFFEVPPDVEHEIDEAAA